MVVRRVIAIILLAAGCAPAEASTPPAVGALLRDFALAHVHGERDNQLPINARISKLQAGDLVAFCGEVSGPVARLLADAGLTARRVSLIALTPDADGVYQGHQVVELWHPDRGRWVVVDIDYGVMFDQTAVSLTSGRVTPEPLEPPTRDPEAPTAYPMVADAVGIWDDGGVVWYDQSLFTESEQQVLSDAGWSPYPRDFTEHFYS